MNVRPALRHNRATLGWLVAAGLPLAGLSLLSGLHVSIAVALIVVVAAAGVGLLRIMGRGPIDWSDRVPTRRALLVAVLALVAVAAAIQLVPYGWTFSNPPVTGEPAWDSAATRELMVKVCFDCHSNEVDYPWYSNVAPVSWAVARHVSAGRDAVNYSEWDRPQHEADETIEVIEEGSMPPWYYGLTHPRLSDAEKSQLIAGLRATPGMAENGNERGEREEHDGDDD